MARSFLPASSTLRAKVPPNGIESVHKNSAEVASFDVRTAKNGEQYFVQAANKEIIGKSEMYKSPSSVKRGIASVMRNAPTARVVEIKA